jgi:DNA-binding XRE family transcriptional regulator
MYHKASDHLKTLATAETNTIKLKSVECLHLQVLCEQASRKRQELAILRAAIVDLDKDIGDIDARMLPMSESINAMRASIKHIEKVPPCPPIALCLRWCDSLALQIVASYKSTCEIARIACRKPEP